MSKLTSQQRKLVYLIGIIALLVPILLLSLPADGKKSPGGKLYQLRSKYELGESDLGDVDPSGAAMNLVLLGMRGVAVDLLWIEMDEQKDMKRWSEMQATTESIVRLQPHYEKVWDMCGWNLSYNTSAEWDAIPDRFFWVKQGAKLLKRGVSRNEQSTPLYYNLAKIIQHKIGYADEATDYRRYFLSDPDPAFKGGPDTEVNPESRDNFLEAKEWYLKACDREKKVKQHILDVTLFRSSPARCQFDYAQGLQKDGKFGEETRAAWELARQDWTDRYGQEEFLAVIGTERSVIHMEMTEEDVKRAAQTPDDEIRIRHAVDQYQKMVNYRYWRTRAYAEAEPETAEAHRSVFEAKKFYKNQEFPKARDAALKAMQGFEDVMKRPEYKDLENEENIVEECILAWKVWDDVYQLMQEKVPDEYPLKWLVQKKESDQHMMQEINKQFRKLLDNR